MCPFMVWHQSFKNQNKPNKNIYSNFEDLSSEAACALLWYGIKVFKNQNEPDKDI